MAGFVCYETYPPENLALKVLLNNYAFLSDDQKRALDLALHFANSIRNEDGCGDKNIATSSLADTQGELPLVTKIPVVSDETGKTVAAEGKIMTEPFLSKDVTVANMLSKKDISDAAFDGTYRAIARFSLRWTRFR